MKVTSSCASQGYSYNFNLSLIVEYISFLVKGIPHVNEEMERGSLLVPVKPPTWVAPYSDYITCKTHPNSVLLCPSVHFLEPIYPYLRAGHLCSSQTSPFPLFLADYLQFSRAFFLISALITLTIIMWLSISLIKGPGDKTYIDLGISIFSFISGTR